MIINLKIDDSLYDHYLTTFGAPGHYKQMKRAIEAFSRIDANDRILIIAGNERKALEAEFEVAIETPEKLLKLVRNMKSVKIEGVEVNFTEDEMIRLATQAGFHGRTTETYLKEMITEIKDRMMETA